MTVDGFTESSPPRPLDELADALWELESEHGSVRGVVAGTEYAPRAQLETPQAPSTSPRATSSRG